MIKLKLREWNDVLDYADKIEEELISDGYNINLDEYSMYDGERGIDFISYDNHNTAYKKYSTGVHDSVEEYKRSINYCKNRLIDE